MVRIFSEDRIIESWLQAEVALARAQALAGVLTQHEADEISRAAVLANIDRARLWSEARNVGYPILPLVRMIVAALPPPIGGRVHYGTTTQDIMDTGLSLQLAEAADYLERLLLRFGDGLAHHVEAHRSTVMAARTHDQQAVPTTFGAKVAVFLGELSRQYQRLVETRRRIRVVSLYGAGGTSAALGPSSREIRASMARSLGLAAPTIPWHVARDSLFEFGTLCVGLTGTCKRFAREIITLSRTEIGEVHERGGHHRGASSTMPQKANPIDSEAVIGMADVAGALASAFHQIMQPEHERAAGEWHVEWQILPQVASLAAGCLRIAGEIAEGMQVFPEAMRRNLECDGGLVMAEAYMIRLAEQLGQAAAHDRVYEYSQKARSDGATLAQLMGFSIKPEDYIGEAQAICTAALDEWHSVHASASRSS
ncbi:adenylosuccinate lyase family protein [bacterium]|nr:MAG: adenylosuccinate lyase family protein [bacterium]